MYDIGDIVTLGRVVYRSTPHVADISAQDQANLAYALDFDRITSPFTSASSWTALDLSNKRMNSGLSTMAFSLAMIVHSGGDFDAKRHSLGW